VKQLGKRVIKKNVNGGDIDAEGKKVVSSEFLIEKGKERKISIALSNLENGRKG